ncbi:MAG: alpha/beta fold hydrolase [Actinomycetes bacterium]|jgi:pimeloyl-ACP methyl ester carboxylesterase
MPSVERSGVGISYEVAGHGFSLVLLHGLSVDGTSWRRAGYVDALSDRYRCISIDARGAGGSDKPDLPALHTMNDYLGDVEGVLDREAVDAFAVWGFSRGGAVALALAARHGTRVRAVVSTGAWDTRPYTLEDIGRTRSIMGAAEGGGMAAMLATWEPDEDPALPEWFRSTILDYDHRAWLAARYGGFCWPEIPVAAITPPALVIVGSREDPAGEAPRWAATLPDGRCVTIPERTHCGAFLATAPSLAHAEPFLDRAVGSRVR